MTLSVFNLNSGLIFTVTEDTWKYFGKCYLRDNVERDCHQDFADSIGVSRIDAKEIAFRMMWTNVLIHTNLR